MNEFGSMDKVKEITNEQELKNIGIMDSQDLNILTLAIKAWKEEDEESAEFYDEHWAVKKETSFRGLSSNINTTE